MGGLLLLAIGVAFGQTVRYEFFNLDDDTYVYENPQVSRGLSAEGIAWAFTQSHDANWHPLTWISLMLDCQVYGLSAGGYHLTNVLLHAATAVLLFLVLQRMTGDFWPGALVAALFAVHPLRVESVAWVTERKDVLSGLFFMLALWAYVGYVCHRFSLARYALLMALFALGLMAKPMLVTLPFVLLLLDYWPLGRFAGGPCHGEPRRGRRDLAPTPPHCMGGDFHRGADFPDTVLGRLRSSRHLLMEKIPLFVLAAVSCVVTFWAQGQAVVPIDRLPFPWRIANALVSYVAYLGQFFCPAGLAVYYPHPEGNLPLWQSAGALLMLACISAGALASWRRCPYLLMGWLWYLGMLVPVVGLAQVGTQAMADRFTYLPQIGLCLALAWGAADLCGTWRCRSVCSLAAALVLALLTVGAWRQTCFWRDSETLWSHTLACTSRNYVAHYDLGNVLAARRRFDAAIPHYRAALEIKPDDAETRNNLGAALQSQGKIDEAMAQYRQALQIKPDYARVRYNLGKLLAGRGQFKEAIAHFEQMLKLQPDHVEAQTILAWLRATCPQASLRNGAEAIEHARRADQLCGGRRPDVLDCLAASYAEAGRFPEALATAQSPGTGRATEQAGIGGWLAGPDQTLRSRKALSSTAIGSRVPVAKALTPGG